METVLNQTVQAVAINDLPAIKGMIYQAKRIVFYDTNSFVYHSRLQNNKYYALDFFNSEDTIIFTDKIIKELNDAKPEIVNERYVNYLNALHAKVPKIIVLKEEHLYNLYDGWQNFKTNLHLKHVFEKGFSSNVLAKKDIKKLNPSRPIFLTNLSTIYNDEVYKHNIGEVSIYISALALCSFRNRTKIAIFSDDYRAYKYMKTLDVHVSSLDKEHMLNLASTVKNIQHVSVNNKFDQDIILEYLSNTTRVPDAKFYFRNKGFDTVINKNLNADELASKIYKNEITLDF